MKKLLFAILPLAVLAACSGGASKERKILITAPGSITIDATNTNISVGDTTSGADNKEIDLKDASVTSINIDNNGKKTALAVPADPGYYIYNAFPAALYGSELFIGKNIGYDMGLDQQKAYIDSVKQILAGTNISAANKNYLLNSGQLLKLNDDVEHTYLFAPFVGIGDVPAASDGKTMRLFKFYTKDELMQRLQSVEDSYNAAPEK